MGFELSMTQSFEILVDLELALLTQKQLSAYLDPINQELHEIQGIKLSKRNDSPYAERQDILKAARKDAQRYCSHEVRRHHGEDKRCVCCRANVKQKHSAALWVLA